MADEPLTLEQRFTRSAAGRAIISGALTIAIGLVVAVNLPAGHLRGKILHEVNLPVIKPNGAQQVMNVIGLGQDWALFAPDPRRRSIDVRAEVTLRDGTKQLWHYPRGNNFTGPYWDYRWAKWLEYMVEEGNKAVLWEPAAKLIAREYGGPAKVQRIQLINRTHEIRPPGTGRAIDGKDEDYRFYAYEPPLPEPGGSAP